MTTHTNFLAALKGRMPNTRRSGDFYRRLDAHFPGWETIVSAREFPVWLRRVDSNNGACMFDRLHALWQDPLYSSEFFASLLRRFVRWRARQTERTDLRIQDYGVQQDLNLQLILNEKYEVLDLLGSGGNGEVYLVWSRETTSLYALKTIRADLAAEPGVRESFRNEARTWIRLGEHPNIAKAHYFEELGQQLYVTMAFVEGEDDGTGPSLADKLNAGPIPLDRLYPWFCQVADGLAHAYANGVRAHRDIKPANILIGRDDVARVSDFGLTVAMDVIVSAGIHKGLIEGTPLYMSPEQFSGPNFCDKRSDIYSLGVTLYQATSGGRLPFSPSLTPRTPEDLRLYFQEVRKLHEHEIPKRLSSPLWPVIKKCLEKPRENRFGNINEFRTALEEIGRLLCLPVPERTVATEDLWTLRDQGNSFMRLGSYKEAIAAFDAFLNTLRDESVIFNRAVCLENLGEYALAFEVYERLARSDDVGGLVNGSNCLRNLNRKDEALTFAKRAVALKDDDKMCWISLGNAAFALARWPEAVRAYSVAHILDSSDPTPPYNLGLAADRAGATEEATRGYSIFLKLSHSDDSRRQYVERALLRLKSRFGTM